MAGKVEILCIAMCGVSGFVAIHCMFTCKKNMNGSPVLNKTGYIIEMMIKLKRNAFENGYP